jgi:hypothetical protein
VLAARQLGMALVSCIMGGYGDLRAIAFENGGQLLGRSFSFCHPKKENRGEAAHQQCQPYFLQF